MSVHENSERRKIDSEALQETGVGRGFAVRRWEGWMSGGEMIFESVDDSVLPVAGEE